MIDSMSIYGRFQKESKRKDIEEQQ